jgi:hypothetical protein
MNFWIMLLLCFGLGRVSLANQGGTDVGNGGDLIAMSFLGIAREVVAVLQTPQGQQFSKHRGLEIQKISKAVSELKVRSVTDILRDSKGIEVDAIFDGHYVVLKRSRWFDILARRILCHPLVLHELARVAGINDDDYRYSVGFEEVVNASRSASSLRFQMFLTPLAKLKEKHSDVETRCDKYAKSGAWTYLVLATVCSWECRDRGFSSGFATECDGMTNPKQHVTICNCMR